MLEKSKKKAETLPRGDLTTHQVRAAIFQVPVRTGLDQDFWQPALLRQLAGNGLTSLTDIINYMEVHLVAPLSALTSLICLLGKPCGSVRPIALTAMVYRIWTRARRQEVGDWDLWFTGGWDSAVRGRGAQSSAYDEEFQCEAARAQGLHNAMTR